MVRKKNQEEPEPAPLPEEQELPESMPLLPVRDVVVFPYMILPLFVARENSVAAVEAAMAEDQHVFLVTQQDQNVEQPLPEDLYEVGTVGVIMRQLKMPDGRLKVLVQGLARARITEWEQEQPFFRVALQTLPDPEEEDPGPESEALMRSAREASEKILALRGLLTSDVQAILGSVDEAGRLADLVASNMRLESEAAQGILEENDPLMRLQKVHEHLGTELEVSTLQAKIQSEAQEEMSRGQREYYLREQLRAIRRELGDENDRAREMGQLRESLEKKRLPSEVRAEALKQLGRMEQMQPESAEASIIRTYLDWILDLPWSTGSKDRLDVKKAAEILDEDHFDLEKVKERILEYLAVRKLNPKMKGPILCFIGPPGVGKTSLGRSIARALGRKFVRISLGGVRDEAEIRGHRRTYIGALPGRIIQGLKSAGANNPVFMIDEVDKVGSDYRGDPTSALLEVLDPEQNNAFSDHYLNLPFDLSKVMFITTANVEDTIPDALWDRMEVIELSGYTEEDKVTIAQGFLIPRQLKENGITTKQISLSPAALLEIIRSHTREAGLRNLEREIGSVCRKVARKVAEGEKGPFKVTAGNLHRYLGVPKFLPEEERGEGEVGVATGLAWTAAGGEVLRVEVSAVEGKGNLTITGSLGEVMRESAQAALSYARGRAAELGLKKGWYDDMDLHVHVPSGAIPKDGPSAGVTLATAIISSLTGVPVREDVAMTGEVTLTGKVLPIGGLKEKALAAQRSGLERILVPEKNQKEMSEIPAKVRRKLKIIPVGHMDQLLPLVLAKWPLAKPAKKKTAPKKTAKKKAASKAPAKKGARK
ncbi:MAG: endopeptidase La [Desulfarculaceae bacterium]|nr:endopeptidase La [Desulfarculaceae bacterium]MCF8071061.1 endopeptidase La [Desulfarculaceae bacterium]MCF8100649.1 endopeptidase La [Desulfarculaceae bacterium]MCF8116917.1 endopeptidase La [Desulfarculaceae bacterium]